MEALLLAKHFEESRQSDSKIKSGRRARGIIKNAAILNRSRGPLDNIIGMSKKKGERGEECREMKRRVFFFGECSSDILNRLCAKDEGDPTSFINM